LGAFLAGYLIDAFHTSALGSANAVCALLERPDVMAQVRASPALLPAAIIEALRLDPPVILLKRYALNDSTIAGVGIRKGIQIAMMWAAGNLDPQAFREPERFEIARQHQRLTTFGTGAHICPGRHAALMLSRILLEAILQGGKLGLAGLPQWHEQHLMCQLKSLPVTFSRSP
jgi:cytochrome P450